jgi:hypothetical protein
MSCSVEIIDFTRPERNRKNLFITNIPGNSETDIQVIYLAYVHTWTMICHMIIILLVQVTSLQSGPMRGHLR